MRGGARGIGSLEVGNNEGAAKMTMGGGYIFTASVTASFYQSSEFRVYSSLTRQTDQESPISLSWRATASFYHTGASFGIEGIHLDGSHSLDVAYGVECEEAKSQVQRHRLPVPRLFGLAVTDEGRRRLMYLSFLKGLTFANIMSSANLGNIFQDYHGTEVTVLNSNPLPPPPLPAD